MLFRTGRVVKRRLCDACEQCCLVSIIHGERGERPTKIVFRRRRKSVLTVSHVDETGVSGQNFFLSAAFRTETLLHLVFDPQRQSNLLQLPNQHVDASRADHVRQRAGQEHAVPELVAVFFSRHVLENRQVFEKMTPHELLGDRRSAMREDRRTIHLVLPS